MKVGIEVVTGFLGAGKTAFINSLINETAIDGEKIAIFQLENGNTKINCENNNNGIINFALIDCEISSLKKYMLNEISVNNPTTIILEYNGTDKLEELYIILSSKELRNLCRLNSVYFICDGPSFLSYLRNMEEILIPFIQSSNLILINNCKNMKEEARSEVRRVLEGINLTSYILTSKDNDDLSEVLRSSGLMDNGTIKKVKLALWKFINKKKRR